MSGRKQHYIPQCLLKGFKTFSKGKAVKAFVFKKGQRPFISSIEDVAAERYFYSKPSNDGSQTLDDEITRYEDELGRLLIVLREAPLGARIDASVAAEVIVHLTIRGANLRDVFSIGVEQLVTGAADIFTNEEYMSTLLGADADVPSPLLEEQIEKLIEEHEDKLTKVGLPKPLLRQIAFTLVRENFDCFFALQSPIFSTILNDIASNARTIVRNGHIKALAANLKPDARVASLSRFVWTICAPPGDDLILPDCVAIVMKVDGTMPEPYIISRLDEICTVFVPISSDRILIGCRNIDQLPDVSGFNEFAAACSQTFFVSSRKTPELENLAQRIGENSQTTLLSAVTSALDEFTNKLFVDKHQARSVPNQVTDEPVSPSAITTVGIDENINHEADHAHDLSYTVTFLGCADQETAQEIAAAVNVVVSEMRRWIPLNRLDHITFAEEYSAALGSLDRGFAAPGPLVPTESEIGIGVAMAPTIIREGVAKACIIMRAWLGRALICKEPEAQSLAIHTLVNQLGNVACVELIDRAMPGVLLSRVDDYWEGLLYSYMHQAWTAYFASRISAAFDPGIGKSNRDTLLAVMDKMKEDIPRERLAYRLHGDIDRFLGSAISSIGTTMIWAAKLLGHYDGLWESPDDEGSSLTQALRDSGLQSWLDTFRSDLDRLFERRGQWESIREFLALNRHIERVLWQFGVFPWRNEQGQVRVEIPLHSDAAQLFVNK